MSAPSAPSRNRQSATQGLIGPILPALTVGAVSVDISNWALLGLTGLIGGGFGALLVSQKPVLFAAAAGLQCFGLGSTFWYIRNFDVRVSSNGTMSNWESVLRSTVAGSMTGAVNGAFRSRSNILPGALIFGLFGMLGQGAYNRFRTDPEMVDKKVPYVRRLLESRWVPLKSLSDHDYMAMLNEKAIKIEAEIAIIDERIAALQKSKKSDH